VRLRTRLLLGLGYVVLLAIVALEIPLALSLSERVDNEVRTQADGQAELIAASAVDRLDRPAQLRAVVASAARNVRGRVLIVGPAGHVLADSASAQARGADYSGRPEIASALAGAEQQATRRSETLDQELLATAVPIADGGRVIGAVRITQSTEAVHSSVRRTIAQLLLIGLAVLLIGLLAGAFIARQIALPVRRLERTARRVADGELSARADESEGSAEQRSLAASFNEMTARIRELLDAQRRFVADASHQLRTPLAGLRLRLEAASAGRPADRDLEAADAEVERLSRIVDDLLTLSRAGETARHASQCDLTEAAHRAAERFRAAAGAHGVRLRVVVESRGARCLCVAAELDRALDALVENALLYGAGGGEVEIVVREGVLEVRDRGRGLAPGEEQEVFERFHRGSAARDGSVKGTGLGLAIARTLARGWGGEATLRAREGGGAVAALVVPPAGSAGPPPEEREEVAA
jgi:signal transduction histidine kinase